MNKKLENIIIIIMIMIINFTLFDHVLYPESSGS